MAEITDQPQAPQRERLSIWIAKTAHELKAVVPPELWLEFMKALSALQDHEVLKMANSTPHPQNTFYQQGRARLAMQLFEQLEQCSEIWKKYRDNEQAKEQARARATVHTSDLTI